MSQNPNKEMNSKLHLDDRCEYIPIDSSQESMLNLLPVTDSECSETEKENRCETPFNMCAAPVPEATSETRRRGREALREANPKKRRTDQLSTVLFRPVSVLIFWHFWTIIF